MLIHPRLYWFLALAGIAAFLLGCWGYWSYQDRAHSERQEHVSHSLSDAIYGSIKLFFLHAAPQPETNVGIWLDIARYVAPIVAGWAALIALISLLRDRAQRMLVPLKSGHLILCGLGYVGFEFLRQLRLAGYKVVVVEADGANPRIKTCHDWGVPVIAGDAQLRSTLEAAGVKRANRLLAVTADSVVNTEIVIRATEIADGTHQESWLGRAVRRLSGPTRHRKMRCLARVSDPGLCLLLRIEEANRGAEESTLDFFNTDELGAQKLFDQYPFGAGRSPHILIAHLDALGSELILHAARKWHHEGRDSGTRLLVTVLDDRARERVRALLADHPVVEQVCEFTCLTNSVRDIKGLKAADRERRAGRAGAANYDDTAAPISQVYVAAGRDETTVETALKLRYALDVTVPVVAALSRAHGVARLLENSNAPDSLRLSVFETLRETCNVELVEGGSFELIAREIHRRYCQMAAGSSNVIPEWSGLDASLKESSRAQARHIGVKLRRIGCEIAPLRDWHAESFTFTAKELHDLSVMEHERWANEKLALGYSYGDEQEGPKKDPHLVPWHELPRKVADWDTNFIKAIPSMLAAVGLQVVDVCGTTPRYPDGKAGVSRPHIADNEPAL